MRFRVVSKESPKDMVSLWALPRFLDTLCISKAAFIADLVSRKGKKAEGSYTLGMQAFWVSDIGMHVYIEQKVKK